MIYLSSYGFMGGCSHIGSFLLAIFLSVFSGGYEAGSTSGSPEPVSFVKDGMVVVAMQYRLGVFGFLSGSRIKAQGALNAGLCYLFLSIPSIVIDLWRC